MNTAHRLLAAALVASLAAAFASAPATASDAIAASAIGTAPPATAPKPPAPAPAAPAAKDETKPAPGAGSDWPTSPIEFVLLDTSMGPIVLELNREKAPISVRNFLAYVDKNYYDDTIFHRVIGNFMIQGGGFTTDLKQKPTDPPIENEWKNGLKNARGTIAMARTSEANSATSQFFINVVDNAGLDQPTGGGAAYAVFGKVIGGMDTVDRIKAVPTGTKTVTTSGGRAPFRDVPEENVVIKKAKRLTADEARALSSAK